MGLAREHDAGRQQRLEANPQALDMSRLYSRAYEMLVSPSVRNAFDLDAEQPRVRDRYGRHRSGQALLLARRLVEAEVPYINVIWNHSNRGQDLDPSDTDVYGWDTHNDIFDSLKDRLLPRFDESFSALIEDLDQRGLLDETLVVCMGEFGRAPRVALEPKFAGATPGRKHWATVYSIAVAGAGVTRGAALGASDRMGAEPVTERYGPKRVGKINIFISIHVPNMASRAAYDKTWRLGRILIITFGVDVSSAWDETMRFSLQCSGFIEFHHLANSFKHRPS
jgi:hypothetical protein